MDPCNRWGLLPDKKHHFCGQHSWLEEYDAAGNSQIPTYIYFNNANYSTITIDTIAPDAPGVTLLDGLGNSANDATAQITANPAAAWW